MSTLFLVGVPLDEDSPLSAHSQSIIEQCPLIIGESKKLALRFSRFNPQKKQQILFLDHNQSVNWQEIESAVREAKIKDHDVALFSDSGMPILFDPGRKVLLLAIKLEMKVRTCPSPTSFGTAMAISGYLPPFFVCDFLPREKDLRLKTLKSLPYSQAHCVLLETPYRFRMLLSEMIEVFGPQQRTFLAWEISKKNELLIWGSLKEVEQTANERVLTKGEFVIVLDRKST